MLRRIVPVIIILLGVFCVDSVAQKDTTRSIMPGSFFPKTESAGPIHKVYELPAPTKYNTWDITGHLGLTYPSTDITGRQKLAIGADLTKFLSQNFAVQARLMHASLSGVDVNQPQYLYHTSVAYDFSLNVLVQLSNFAFLPGQHRVAVYGTAGFGVMHYSPEVYIDGGHIPYKGIYSQYTAPFVITDYEGSSDLVVPLGLGAKYQLDEKYTLRLEYSVRRTYSDKLDGFFKLLSADDSYSYLNFGVSYQLGHEEKSLQWSNPLQTAYDDLYKVKEQLEQFSRDGDHDGVIDLYDKEKNTPAGAKVYGDGTSIDTDDDGVPDYRDSELFSPKYAIVDATGREIIRPAEKPETVSPAVTPAVTENKNALPLTINKSADTSTKTNELKKPATIPPASSNSLNATLAKKENVLPTEEKVVVPPAFSKDTLPSVFFSVKEDRVSEKHYATLKIVAKIMNDNPGVDYKITGVCDPKGSVKFNLGLGRKRAEAVRKYLVGVQKVNPFRLSIDSKISKQNSGSPAENRRVDFVPVRKK